ncbi:MAG: hypothetical protein RJA76_328 [Bacteroidota bacterium]
MKIKQVVFFFSIVASLDIFAQNTSNGLLAPIDTKFTIWGKEFIYKNQLIDDPLALQIPLLEAKDPEISYEFLTFKNQRKTMRWISSISTFVALYSFLDQNKVSNGFYWSVVGSSAIVNIYLAGNSNKHLNKALQRYNTLANRKVSLQMGSISNNLFIAPQIGMNYQF